MEKRHDAQRFRQREKGYAPEVRKDAKRHITRKVLYKRELWSRKGGQESKGESGNPGQGCPRKNMLKRKGKNQRALLRREKNKKRRRTEET